MLAEFEQMDLERGTRWVLLGLAYWVDEKRTIRMTVRGTWAHLKSMFKQIGKLSAQPDRAQIRRAG